MATASSIDALSEALFQYGYQGSDGGLYPQRQRVLIVHITKRKTLAIQNMDFDARRLFSLAISSKSAGNTLSSRYLNERHKHVNKEEECRHVVDLSCVIYCHHKTPTD